MQRVVLDTELTTVPGFARTCRRGSDMMWVAGIEIVRTVVGRQRGGPNRRSSVVSTAGPVVRWLRALVLAGVATLTGVVAHVSGGGYLPPAIGLVSLWFMVAVAVAPLLGRELSTVRVVVLLMAGQTVIHAVLTTLVGHRDDSPSPGSVPTPVHHPAGGEHLPSTVPHWAGHLVNDLAGPHALMALTHLAAAGAVGLWLAAGERALWTVLTATARPVVESLAVLLGSALQWATSIVASSADRRVRLWLTAWAGTRRACAVFLPDTLTRRGPPALLAG
jgi:hypothetical protein